MNDIIKELAVMAENKANFHSVRYAIVRDDDGVYRLTPLTNATDPLYITRLPLQESATK